MKSSFAARWSGNCANFFENSSTQTEMKIRSVNVGIPREVEWHGRIVTTGILKEPVAGPRPAAQT